MKRFVPLLMALLAVVAGVVFVISGIHTLLNKDLYDSTVTAVIVDAVEEWDYSDPDSSRLITTYYIDYTVGGQKFEHVESPESDSSMKIGDTVEILYQSKDPSKISAKNITTGAVIFIAAGAVVALGGAFSAIRAFTKQR